MYRRQNLSEIISLFPKLKSHIGMLMMPLCPTYRAQKLKTGLLSVEQHLPNFCALENLNALDIHQKTFNDHVKFNTTSAMPTTGRREGMHKQNVARSSLGVKGGFETLGPPFILSVNPPVQRMQ